MKTAGEFQNPSGEYPARIFGVWVAFCRTTRFFRHWSVSSSAGDNFYEQPDCQVFVSLVRASRVKYENSYFRKEIFSSPTGLFGVGLYQFKADQTTARFFINCSDLLKSGLVFLGHTRVLVSPSSFYRVCPKFCRGGDFQVLGRFFGIWSCFTTFLSLARFLLGEPLGICCLCHFSQNLTQKLEKEILNRSES